jgi:hypothetical protein
VSKKLVYLRKNERKGIKELGQHLDEVSKERKFSSSFPF